MRCGDHTVAIVPCKMIFEWARLWIKIETNGAQHTNVKWNMKSTARTNEANKKNKPSPKTHAIEWIKNQLSNIYIFTIYMPKEKETDEKKNLHKTILN